MIYRHGQQWWNPSLQYEQDGPRRTHSRTTLTATHLSLNNVLEGTIHHCTIQNVFYNVCKKVSSAKVRLIYLSTEASSGRAPGSEGVCYSSDLHVRGIRQHVRSKYYIEHFKIDYWETLQLIRAKKSKHGYSFTKLPRTMFIFYMIYSTMNT